jgi:hypothetical protein
MIPPIPLVPSFDGQRVFLGRPATCTSPRSPADPVIASAIIVARDHTPPWVGVLAWKLFQLLAFAVALEVCSTVLDDLRAYMHAQRHAEDPDEMV